MLGVLDEYGREHLPNDENQVFEEANSATETARRARNSVLRLNTLTLAFLMSILVARFVTMQTVPIEYDVPAYGFPFPALGWTGVSSGVWWFAPLPFALDLMVAMIVAFPAALVVRRVTSSRATTSITAILSIIVIALHVGSILPLAVGAARFHSWYPHADWPVECRSISLGRPDAILDYSDESNRCVQRRLNEAGNPEAG